MVTLKEGMTSFDVAAVVSELKRTIVGARLRNVYQIDPRTLILKLHKPDAPSFNLLIEAGRRMHLTNYAVEKPLRPPAFCAALRRHLRNGELVDVQQHEFERIVVLNVRTKEGDLKLVVELFGEGNFILVDFDGRILHALVYKRMRDRNVLRDEFFKHAPSSGRNPLKASRAELNEIKAFGKIDVVRALTKFFSIGGLYAEEILLRAGVNKGVPCDELTEEALDGIYRGLQQLLLSLREEKFKPQVILNEKNEEVDVVPTPLTKYEGLTHKAYGSFNEALDDIFTKAAVERELAEASKELGRKLLKQYEILERQRKALEKAKEDVERNKRAGDVIYAHLHELNSLLQRIAGERRAGRAWDQVLKDVYDEKEVGKPPAAYVESIDVDRSIVNVSLDGMAITLDLTRPPQDVASRHYERAKKAEAKLKGVEVAIQETEKRIDELRLKVAELKGREDLTRPRKVRKRAWYEKFRWFRSSDGFLILGGRDATTNEVLIKKYMEPRDIVLHADVVGAPFVLIKTEGKEPFEQTIKEAAQLAASYSRAWKMGLSSADAYWVRPEQVSKSPPLGQSLKKGSFVIRGKKNYVKCVPLRVAIGVSFEDDEPIVIGGPTDAVLKSAELYVEIAPGDEPSGQLSKRILKAFEQKAPERLRSKILSVPLEDVQKLIPYGRGRLLS